MVSETGPFPVDRIVTCLIPSRVSTCMTFRDIGGEHFGET